MSNINNFDCRENAGLTRILIQLRIVKWHQCLDSAHHKIIVTEMHAVKFG